MAFFKKSLNQLDSHGNLKIIKEDLSDRVIALAGNPNVGKSTVFNNLTGMKQHTGNWPGKTVVNAQGRYKYNNKNFILVDIPGTYSLAAISPEEGVARDFLCFGEADAIAVVLDATCLERNLNLLLQILEVRREVVLCVNLLDEAQKKGIRIDLPGLSRQLAIPVVGCKAAIGEGLDQLMAEIDKISVLPKEFGHKEALFSYGEDIEEAIHILQIIIRKNISKKLDSRWLALRLLDMDDSLALSLAKYLGRDILDENNIKENGEILTALAEVKKVLAQKGYGAEKIKDKISEAILFKAEEIYQKTVGLERADYNHRDRKIDKILTSKTTGIPLMLLLLAMVFWLTIVGANYPSQLLSSFFFWLEGYLTKLFVYI
ncbi:MAG: FeoB small GTPase domain-containing protein, partial [Clostridiales bacterium]